jgi:hypothetical protein
MKALNLEELEAIRARRCFDPAKKLTVGQLRIATIPQVLAPARIGPVDPGWLRPIEISKRVS